MISAQERFGPYSFQVSNRDKILFPEATLTKGDLIDYYRKIADVMVPHVKGRPLTMHRFPDGIDGPEFYQKDTPDYFPDWIQTHNVAKEDGNVNHVVCQNAATLAYLASQASITPHVWLSRISALKCPDQAIFDLDPSAESLSQVRKAAFDLRELLEVELNLKTWIKTTGSRGYHLVVPLDGKERFDEVRGFARSAAQELAKRHPDQYTVEMRKEKRGDRVFIDYLRNAYAQTAVAPYAVRATKNAPVATPIDWSELEDVAPSDFTVKNILSRISEVEDPWKNLQRHRYSLSERQKRLEELAGE